MRLITSSTLTNQNITAALLVHTYTADIARGIFVQVYADQVAGNGTYTLYRTVQKSGAGSAYEDDSRESIVVATGITAVLGRFSRGLLFLQATDVLKVYLLGLGGDTTTPDIRTEIWEDDSLRPTAADNTLDVSATGEAGLDWANIGAPTTSVNLSGTSTRAVEPTTLGRTLDVAATGEAGLDFSNVKQATGSTTLNNITVPIVTTLTNNPSNLDIASSVIKTELDAVKAKTDLLPADPASQGTTSSAITAAVSPVDSHVLAVKAKTDALPSNPAAVGSKMDLQDAPNATAITAIQNGLALQSLLTTVSNKLGAWTGSGRNTVLGALQAMFRKDSDASIPSNINADLGSGAGTANNTEDSQEAIRDRGDAAWTGGGAAPTVVQIRQEMDSNSTQLSAIKTQTDKLTFTVANKVDSNTLTVGGDATAATNQKAFFNGTGYAGTNNVIPIVTTLTNGSSGIATLVSLLTSGRAALLDNLAMLAGWTGTLLTALRSLARNDTDSSDIGGTYDKTIASLQAQRIKLDTLAAVPATTTDVTIRELNT